MKKKILIWIIGIILLSSLASADKLDYEDFTAVGDWVGGGITSVANLYNGSAGVVDGGATNSNRRFTNTDNDAGFNITFVMNVTTPNDLAQIMVTNDPGTGYDNTLGNFGLQFTVHCNDDHVYTNCGDLTNYAASDWCDNIMRNVTFRIYNDTAGGNQIEYDTYVDTSGTEVLEQTGCDVRNDGNISQLEYFVVSKSGPKMGLDDLRITNTTIAAAAGGDTLNVSITSPTNNTNTTLSTFSFNATVNSTGIFNCSKYLNDTLNGTKTNIAAGQDVYIEWNETLVDGFYNYTFRCNDNLTGVNTTAVNFLIDSTNPVFTVSPTLDSNLSLVTNETILEVSINISDDNLYALNITLEDGTIIFNTTALDTTDYEYNLSFDPTQYGLVNGVHTLIVESSDAHTAEWIPNWLNYKNPLTKAITYEFDNGGWITIEPTSRGFFGDMETWKTYDRYLFKYTRGVLGGENDVFEVTSSAEIDIIENSGYDGHMVVYGLRKWIDFETGNEKAIVTTEQINEKKVIVTISGIDTDEIIFNSLGGLNVVRIDYSFYYGNVTETFENVTLEGDMQTFSLNFTRNDSFVSGVTANLHFNGTQYTPTKTTATDYIHFSQDIQLELNPTADIENNTVQWAWNITNYGGGNNITNETEEKNQTSYKMVLSNCTGETNATFPSLNITTRDEISDVLINSDVASMFKLWNYTKTFNRTYSMAHNAHSTSAYCIFPDWAALNTDYEIDFTATGYSKREVDILGGELLSNHTNITIYMTSDGNTTQITTIVVDENDDALQDYTVEAYRYNLATDDYTLIDTKTTNSEGKSLFNLYVAISEYRFVVKNIEGTIVHVEKKQLLTETSYTFRVQLGTTPDSPIINLQALDYTLTADTDNNITLSWNDDLNLIDDISLKILRTNTTETTELYSLSSSADVGSLYQNVSTSGVYVANAYATYTEDGAEYFLSSVTVDIREEWDVFGTESIFMTFLFVGTMMFIGIAISAEASLILTLVGMLLFYLLGFIQITLGGLVPLITVGIIIIARLFRR